MTYRIKQIIKEMQDRKVNNGKHHSDTLRKWSTEIADQLKGAELCEVCEAVTACLNGDGCSKWCCKCGARLNGNYI